jgi:hypothetical protein
MIGFLFLKIFQINIKMRLKTILTKLGIINWKLIIINPYITQHVEPTKAKTHNFIGINLKFLNFTTFLITKIGSKEHIIEHTTHKYPITSLLLINTTNKKYITKVNVNKIKAVNNAFVNLTFDKNIIYVIMHNNEKIVPAIKPTIM